MNIYIFREIDFSWCRCVDDEIVEIIIEKCRALKKVILWGCSSVSDLGVAMLLKKGIEVIGKDQYYVA